jgi:hypothetical protein
MTAAWDFAGVAALLLAAAGGIWWDRSRYGSWLTPFTLLAAPLALVMALAFVLAVPLGFVPPAGGVALLWLPALAVFWLVGQAGLWPLWRRLDARGGPGAFRFSQEEEAYWLVIVLGWITIAIMAVGLQVALAGAGGWRWLGSAEFRSIFGSGVYGHANVFSLMLLIYLLGSRRLWEPLTLLTAAALVSASLIYGVKSWLILPVLAGVYYRISTGRLRVSPLLLLAVALGGIGMFFAIYLLRFAADGTRSLLDLQTYVDLLRHFAAYLFAGVLGFSEFLRLGRTAVGTADPLAPFAPFVNLYRFLLEPDAPLVTIINPNYLVISTAYQKHSNVPTLVGTLWLYWDVAGMLLYMAGLSLVMHAAFLLCQWVRNCWLLVAWSFWAVLLAMSWFEMYFWHLTSIEVPVLALAMIGATALWAEARHLAAKARKANESGKTTT